jgi:hypothetical protein
VEYSEHHVANFVIQHLIMNCADATILAQIHDEIAPSLEQLYFQNRAGVVAKLFEAGIEAKALQGPLIKVRMIKMIDSGIMVLDNYRLVLDDCFSRGHTHCQERVDSDDRFYEK